MRGQWGGEEKEEGLRARPLLLLSLTHIHTHTPALMGGEMESGYAKKRTVDKGWEREYVRDLKEEGAI